MQRLIAELEKRVVQAQNEIKAFTARKAQLTNDCDAEVKAHQAIIDETTKALNILKANNAQ